MCPLSHSPGSLPAVEKCAKTLTVSAGQSDQLTPHLFTNGQGLEGNFLFYFKYQPFGEMGFFPI